MDPITLGIYVGIFIGALIGGYLVGYFVRISLKVIAFMLGFYIAFTAVLWGLGLITINVNIEQAKQLFWNLIQKIEIPKLPWDKYTTAIAGGVLGFYLGLRGGLH